MATNISNEASSHKNTVSTDQEHPSIPRPTGHQTGLSEGMHSPPTPNSGRSQENPSGPGLPQSSAESHKQEVDGQRQSANHCPPQNIGATTVTSHPNTSNNSSTDPAPPNGSQHTQNSPQQKVPSPALLQQKAPPPHAAASQNSSQQISENNFPHMQNGHQKSEQQQSIHKQQQPQATQGTPPQCHPQSSPQQMNTQPHNSLLPPHHVPQNTSPSPQRPTQSSPAQPGPPQPAPLTSLPHSHPTPLLPSQPSPADHGDQRPSEPTSRADTESTAGPPQNTIMKSGAPNGIYKHQAFSPNHHQTMLVGSNQGMQAQRGPAPAHNTAMPPHSQGQANGAMGPYGLGNDQHQHLGQTNMRPMPPPAHHTFHNQTINPLHNTAHHPTYHQQGGTAYSYHMAGQQHPQAHPNMYPPHQYQQQHYYPQLHPQAQAHNQANIRGSYPPEEWHRSHYQPRQPMQPNAYLPVASARGNGHLKENSVSPLGSEGSSGANLVSPGPVPEVGPQPGGPEDGKGEGREQASGGSSSGGSPAKQAHKEISERPESPKEILDLDSHNAAARHRSAQPPQQQRPPASAAHMMSGFMYDPRAVHPGMQQGGVPPPHMLSQARGGPNRAPYPGQPYPDPGCYAAQRPHPHLMEALQRPQQLPYSPGQTRMAMYRHPHPAGHFQGMMIQQRGLAPEHFLHPG